MTTVERLGELNLRSRLPSFGAGEVAWAALGLGVITYNALTTEGQMLSQQADRWIERHPVLARAAVSLVAAHVANAVPSKFDPVHWGFEVIRHLVSASANRNSASS